MRKLLALFVLTLALGGCAASAPREVLGRTSTFGTPIALPPVDTQGTVPLEKVLGQRRSAREFSPAQLPIATIGQLLWAGQGITDGSGRRTAPSAGGLYPLELYVVTPGQLLHYVPSGHRVETRPQGDVRPELQQAALDQPAVGSAPDVIVVAAVPSKTTAKYGKLGDTFVALEAGHCTQNILLEATALQLAAVPIGSVNSDAVKSVLALPPDVRVFYLLPVGRPASAH